MLLATHLPVLHSSRICLSELAEKNILENNSYEDRDKNNFLLQTVVLISSTSSLRLIFFFNILTSLNQFYSQAGVRFWEEGLVSLNSIKYGIMEM